MATKPTPISLGRGSNQGRHGQTGRASWTNIYVEDLGVAGKTPFTANAINGWRSFATLAGSAGVDAMLAVDNSSALVVHGRVASILNSAGAATVIGGIGSDGHCTLARNRLTPDPQIAVVRDGLWYIVQGGVMTPGTDPDLPPPICVVEVDGYFVFLIRDGRFFLAGPNNASTDALDFAEAESSSDLNVTAVVRGRTLIIMGENSTEFWDPNGDATFPFGRSAAIRSGCYAAGSVAKALAPTTQSQLSGGGSTFNETVVFAGTDHNGAYAGIMRMDGYAPRPISNGEVDRAVRDAGDASNITGSMGWTEDAHPFYTLNCGAGVTYCYDFKTGEWHKRASYGLGRWRGNCHIQFAGKTLFGAWDRPTIYQSLPTVYDEDGTRILVELQPPPIHMFPLSFKVAVAHIDAISGVGINSTVDDDANPKMLVDYSKDGGENFAAAREIELGATGQRYVRAKVRALGRFDHNGLTLRIRSSAKTIKSFQQLAIVAKPLRG